MTVLVSDSFNRADNSSTLGSTDSYAGGTTKTWVMYQSSGTYGMGISANQAYRHSQSGSTDSQFAGFDIGVSDVSVTVTFANVGTKPILALRATAPNSYISIQSEGLGTTYSVYEYNVSTWTQKASINGCAHGDVIKVTLNGSSVTVFKNNVQVATYTSTFNQTATKFGINATNSSSNKFDNFIIEDLNTGGTPTTQDGTISVIGTGTLASAGRILKNSSASLVGTGSFPATATKLQNALASMVGTGTLTATPVTIKNGQASILGQGLVIANASTQSGIVIVDGNASLLGNGLFGATATTIIQGNASLLGQGVFTSNGIRETFGAVSFIGNGLFNVDLREITIVTGEAWLIGSGVFEAKAQGRTWEDAPYLAIPMYAVVQITEKNWKEVIQEKVKF